MKLFIVRVDDFDYDEYDSHVVAAEDEANAVEYIDSLRDNDLFVMREKVLPGEKKSWIVEEIGVSNSDKPGIIHSSFNKG